MNQATRTSTAISLALLSLAFAGCSNSRGSVTDTDYTSSDDMDEGDITTINELVEYLQGEGHTAAVGQSISQPFFEATATEVTIDGAPVQVFVYDSEDEADPAVDTISPDGSTIGTSDVDWLSEPHFYQSGPLVALYVGTSDSVLDALEDALGAQVAGGPTDDEDIGTDDVNIPNTGTGAMD